MSIVVALHGSLCCKIIKDKDIILAKDTRQRLGTRSMKNKYDISLQAIQVD